ncbi:MAG: Lon protease 2 [Bacteroidota bacterium]
MFDKIGIKIELPDWMEDMEDMPPFPFESDEMDDDDDNIDAPDGEYPVLPLRNTVLFPSFIAPITVGRDKSRLAVQAAFAENKLIAVFGQVDADVDDPLATDMFAIGTLARVAKMFNMPDGNTTAVLQGRKRILMGKVTQKEPFLRADVMQIPDKLPKNEQKMEATISLIREKAKAIIELSPNIPNEAAGMIENIDSPYFLIHFTAANLNCESYEKQGILEIDDIQKRGEAVLKKLQIELKLAELREEIEQKTRTELDKQQREYHLSQQLKTLQDELGEGNEREGDDLETRAATKKWSKATQEQFAKELRKLRRMNTQQPDYGIQLNYLETLVDLPFGEMTDDNFDLAKAKKILDLDHFGLEKVKERILEHLAILKLKKDMKAPILCLVGPPGVGKTSLGQSIASALNRKYHRIALGGLHDEAEIRGHRRTYLGSMPGRIIQALKKSGCDNPVIVLDEIDKIGRDFRGDPQNALLEVLDPQQNSTFHDNFLDVDYDLSKVLFIATANSLEGIQEPLLDRMEVIRLSGYTIEEKLEIAKRHLMPHQLAEHGLKAAQLKIPPKVMADIIQRYTWEAGVREINRCIAALCRATAKKVALEETYKPTITYSEVTRVLGPEYYDAEVYTVETQPGIAVGLAWTRNGGDILYIETSLSKGKGNFKFTGNIGDVMNESATTALSFLQANAEKFGIDYELFEQKNIHIHIPEGATPKDGPSAGITMLTAIASALTNRQVKPYLAMTGEITLRGKVLPVGGIKEKILAAKRAGVREIILCKQNERHILDIQADYIAGLTFHYVTQMSEVLQLALV